MAPGFFEEFFEKKILCFTAEKIHEPAAQHTFFPGCPAPFFAGAYHVFFYGIAAVKQQHFMYLYLHRAHFGAFSAKARGITQVFKLFHATGMRADNGANWAAVSGLVSVAAYVFINRAGI